MKLGPVDVSKYRTPLVVAAAVTGMSSLIELVDTLHPLPDAWIFVRAGLGLVLELVLLALLVRWLGERQRRRGMPQGRFASLTARQQWLLAAALFVLVSAALIGAGVVAAFLARS